MSTLGSFLAAAVPMIGATALGCVGPEPDVQEIAVDAYTDFDEFKAQLPRHSESGAYVVEGDILIHSDEELADYFAQAPQPGQLIVHRTGARTAQPAEIVAKLRVRRVDRDAHAAELLG